MWRPIIAGVDASPEGAWAAAAAWHIASAAGVPCRLAHAVREVWLPPGDGGDSATGALRDRLLADARDRISESLRDGAPADCVDCLDVRAGRPTTVLAEAAAEVGAALIVVGGKRHTGFGRWIAGRTAHNLVRTVDVPVLIVRDPEPPQRVLAGVDLTLVAQLTLEAAEQFARLAGARLKVLHAVEPLPSAMERDGLVNRDEYRTAVLSYLDDNVWPWISLPEAERAVRYATAQAAIEIEAAAWPADLVVVGSHGKGWMDRVLLGSVTEALLNDLPASLLVVPVRRRAPYSAANPHEPQRAQRSP